MGSQLYYLRNYLNKPDINVLDVGCGNHSPQKTKWAFPHIKYYGLDKSKDYNLDDLDFRVMEKFYEVDLSNIENLKIIPDNYFDVIIMSHILEHLKNGDEVLEIICNKLRKNGVIYIECPTPESVRFPHMKGTLNFYDDPTHVRMFPPEELKQILINKNFTIVCAGTVRFAKRILLIPAYILWKLIETRSISANTGIRDLFGFMKYILAVKK